LRSTQTPTRPSRISPTTLKAARASMIQAFQRRHEGAHVAAALRQVQHHIGHPLAGAVIGELAAAPALEHREAIGLDQVRGLAETPAV
jgi:hypothetical protein